MTIYISAVYSKKLAFNLKSHRDHNTLTYGTVSIFTISSPHWLNLSLQGHLQLPQSPFSTKLRQHFHKYQRIPPPHIGNNRLTIYICINDLTMIVQNDVFWLVNDASYRAIIAPGWVVVIAFILTSKTAEVVPCFLSSLSLSLSLSLFLKAVLSNSRS